MGDLVGSVAVKVSAMELLGGAVAGPKSTTNRFRSMSTTKIGLLMAQPVRHARVRPMEGEETSAASAKLTEAGDGVNLDAAPVMLLCRWRGQRTAVGSPMAIF